ncbi:MAG: ribosome biogenesis GTPase Der [Candidatus Omnitrophota bacterium]|jgi:GTP-binding protein|nr:MAG: ribosome biogenesis GTPase Der [Candidatus Omnitrophota bacterium]
MNEKQSIVVIVGRPNVGKSTLFNRIIGHREAIVDDQPGVTRDSKYRKAEWNGKSFLVVDTGGFFGPEEDPLTAVVQHQIEITARNASLLLFLLDAKAGPTPTDHEILDFLRRLHIPILVVANKTDNPKCEAEWIAPFYELGVEKIFPISAIQGLGIGDLLDVVADHLPESEIIDSAIDIPGVAILGRPNVGKSTLLNSLCGEERAIVSPIAGTTRDPVDTEIVVDDQHYLLIDTAGIRRRGKMSQGLDRYSLVRAEEALKRCHIALLMIDGSQGLTESDAKVFGLAKDAGKAALILVNKWDTVEKDEKTSGAFAKLIREQMPFLKFAPIEFVSALTKQRLHRIFPKVKQILVQYHHRVPTAELNRLLEEILTRQPPPIHKGRAPRIYYWTQAAVAPPTFVIFSNEPKAIHFSYERYLINRLYETFGFEGTPIRLIFKKRGKAKS